MFALLTGPDNAFMSEDGAQRARLEKEDAPMATKATKHLAELKGNVDAWYDGRIDYDAFTARQRAFWDAIRAAGPAVEDRVLRALRDNLPSPRPVTHAGRA